MKLLDKLARESSALFWECDGTAWGDSYMKGYQAGFRKAREMITEKLITLIESKLEPISKLGDEDVPNAPF